MAGDRGLDSVDRLTQDFHVYPDFHGNRSPVADPTLKGMVSHRVRIGCEKYNGIRGKRFRGGGMGLKKFVRKSG